LQDSVKKGLEMKNDLIFLFLWRFPLEWGFTYKKRGKCIILNKTAFIGLKILEKGIYRMLSE
jgi:hypothetical protein